jgi:endonuclease/exonuclease/phosphatase family metal-dependent hydrolase
MYGGWPEENAAHVEALIDWVEEKAGDGGQVVVLGDLNTGPAGDGITASFPENYAQLPEAGFENAFLRGDDAACTFCGDNPLVASESGEAGAAIDHALTRGIDGDIDVERVLDGRIDIEIPSEDGEETLSTALSDHYGLRATIEL